MVALPTGTVTFLLTDVVSSTKLWEEQPDAMQAAVARHDAVLGEAVTQYEGVVIKSRGEGDSVFAAFTRPSDAVHAALAAESWGASGPLRVRMALHTGEAELRDGDYYGAAVNCCARLRSSTAGMLIPSCSNGPAHLPAITRATQALLMSGLTAFI